MCTYDLLLVKVEEGINSDISDSLCGLYYDVSEFVCMCAKSHGPSFCSPAFSGPSISATL